MTIASPIQQLFSPEIDYMNMFEHKITSYRFAIPLRHVHPTEKSNWRFRRRMKYAMQFVRFRTFARLSYSDQFLPAKSSHVRSMLNRLGTIRRRNKMAKLEYVWRIDYGEENGRPHYHILLSCTIDHKLLAKYWGKGWIWIEYIRTKEQAMEYVYKYMSKYANETQPVKRRYGCSRKDKNDKGGIPKTPPPEYLKPVLIRPDEYHELVELHNESLKEIVEYSNPK